MRRTRLGLLILASGWACFPLAFAARSIALAFLGCFLVALVLSRAGPEPAVRVTRKLAARAAVGQDVEIVTVVEGPPDLPIFVRDEPPAGAVLRSMSLAPYRGTATQTMIVGPTVPGILQLASARVRVQDAWGLVEVEIEVPLLDHVRVLPSGEALAAGAGLSRDLRDPGSTSRRHRGKQGEIEFEIERLRDHAPGDPVRFIDWPHSLRLQKLITREMSRQDVTPIMVLLHAGPSVRWPKRHAKLGTATYGALAVLSAAASAGRAAGLVAWSERGVEVRLPPARGRAAAATALASLAHLPPAPSFGVADEGAEESDSSAPAAPSAAAREFLAMAASFDRRAPRGATPLEAALGALQQACPMPVIVVAFLDVEDRPALAQAVISRLRHHGHRIVIAGFASGAHHYSLSEIDDVALNRLRAWRVNRATAANACQRARVPFTVLPPRASPAEIAEVIRSAQ